MLRRALLSGGLAGILAPAAARAAAGKPAPHVFVRIDFAAKFPLRIDEALDAGRLEVWSGETFVGCAMAPVHIDAWDYHWLAPLSLGFMAPGPASAIKVKTFGEPGRYGRPLVKVTEQVP